MNFEWDEAKAESNKKKHGVTFDEALTVFMDPLAVIGSDPLHSGEEDRYTAIGQSLAERLLIVTHVDRGGAIRIISARKASRRERKDHQDGRLP